MYLLQECKLIGDLAIHFADSKYEAIRDKFKLKNVTGYTDTYWIAQYDIISTGNCGDKSTYTHVRYGAISSSDCRQKCDNDVYCIIYATKESNPTNINDDFCVTYSKCDIVPGSQYGGTFYRKPKGPGYFYQTDPYDPTTNTGSYNQAKECINLNDPTNETTNKIPNVVSRK